MALGPSAIVTAPDPATAHALRTALSAVPADALTCPDAIRAVLPVAAVMGPAGLAYVTEDAWCPRPDGGGVQRLSAGPAAVTALLEAAGRTDAEESGLAEITSPAFAVCPQGAGPVSAGAVDAGAVGAGAVGAGAVGADEPVLTAAAGYRHWPRGTAHLCVLTAPDRRGEGLARRVASAAVAHALAAGLLPQWRARLPASRRVARALGFQEVGSQLSVRLADSPGTGVPGMPYGRLPYGRIPPMGPQE
ncbi:GNAT family N-acetyltransferase [Streptomyces sp. NPDC018045]|uniref:GNAT family N-acetyltransferase n=1 Tax=Streptomyces sp. NPDC018045 TaxID=3365037 RepID=UPI0037A24745